MHIHDRQVNWASVILTLFLFSVPSFLSIYLLFFPSTIFFQQLLSPLSFIHHFFLYYICIFTFFSLPILSYYLPALFTSFTCPISYFWLLRNFLLNFLSPLNKSFHLHFSLHFNIPCFFPFFQFFPFLTSFAPISSPIHSFIHTALFSWFLLILCRLSRNFFITFRTSSLNFLSFFSTHPFFQQIIHY